MSPVHFNQRPIRLVLFDLDGTLADTAPDLAFALNQTLLRHGHEALPFAQIRPHVSHGGVALIRAGFQIEPGHPKFEIYRQDLLAVYLENIARETRLFPGMPEVLERLEGRGIAWGVVTNKPSWLTDPLMQALNLGTRAACIISGDTLSERKPHPGPITHACALAGVPPEACIYIGDAERDIQAGRAAGTATLSALFGYLDKTDTPEDWGANAAINKPLEILEILGMDR